MSERRVLLDVQGAAKRFGGVTAVDGVSFGVDEGEIVGVIGPNGAGKSTLFNLVSGLHPPSAGNIVFAGRNMADVPDHRRSSMGMARTFQLVRMIEDLTVLENVLLGAHCRTVGGVASTLLRARRAARLEKEHRDEAAQWLDRLGVIQVADQKPDEIPHGTQRLVEIARAMMSRPRLLMLDEPAAGLNATETGHLFDTVCAINREGVAVLIVEHDVDFILRLSNRVVVLDHGALIATGTPDEVRGNEAVIAAYLGRKAEHAAH